MVRLSLVGPLMVARVVFSRSNGSPGPSATSAMPLYERPSPVYVMTVAVAGVGWSQIRPAERSDLLGSQRLHAYICTQKQQCHQVAPARQAAPGSPIWVALLGSGRSWHHRPVASFFSSASSYGSMGLLSPRLPGW
jgi:hypothetical protein